MCNLVKVIWIDWLWFGCSGILPSNHTRDISADFLCWNYWDSGNSLEGINSMMELRVLSWHLSNLAILSLQAGWSRVADIFPKINSVKLHKNAYITVDSLYLEHPLSRTSLYVELMSRSLCVGCNLFSLSISNSLYLEQILWSLASSR